MRRKILLRLLDRYPRTHPDDADLLAKTRRFVEQNPDCFERTLAIGHLTGSAWIVSPDRNQVLLTHHRKLNQWLQPGGHADGYADLFAVALREAREETGLNRLHPLSTEIFDIDIHKIPATAKEAAHYHYDIRFIFEATPENPLVISRESRDLAWVPLANLAEFRVDSSIFRMVDKRLYPGRLEIWKRSYFFPRSLSR